MRSIEAASRPEPKRSPLLTRLALRHQRNQDALDGLTPFGWRGGLVFILAFSLVSFLLYGYFVAYWRNADMDFMIVYSALSLNDGAKQAFFDHPAYLTILSIESWFRILHQLRFLNAWTLSAIPPASDTAGFDAAMTSAIRAGRVLALMTAIAIVLAFASMVRRIVDDRRLATCAVFALAMSGGLQMHLRIVRSEMIAAGFCIVALMLLILAARRATIFRPLTLGAAGSLCILGLENKVHAILLIAFIPMIPLSFSTRESASVSFWRSGAGAWLCATVAALIAAAAALTAWPLIAEGLSTSSVSAAGLKPLLMGRPGVYQLALLCWIVGCMIGFAAMAKVCLSETVASVSLLSAGAALGLLALNIQHDVNDVVVTLNPLEKMMTYVDARATAESPIGAVGLLLTGVVGVLKRYTFILFSSPRPTVFLTWLIVPGIIYAWRHGHRQVACQAALLMFAALTIDALGVRRGLKVEYFVFTDPLIIIAGALLMDRIVFIRSHPTTFPIGATLIALHMVVGQAEPLKMILKRSGPEGICEWHQE